MCFVMPFHNCGDKACSGRRNVPCGEPESLPTSRTLPEPKRDGAFEALHEHGVLDAVVNGLKHLGWVANCVQVQIEVEVEGGGVELVDKDGVELLTEQDEQAAIQAEEATT